MRGSKPLFLLFILFAVLGPPVLAQDVLFETERPVDKLKLNNDGRLHVLTDRELCQYEGISKIGDCINIPQWAENLITVKDDRFVLIGQNKWSYYEHGQTPGTDTLPDLITSGEVIGGRLLIGTATGLFSYNFEDLTQSNPAMEGEFVNYISLVQGDTAVVALDDGIALVKNDGTLIRKYTCEAIINRVVRAENEFLGLTSEGHLFFLGEQSMTRELDFGAKTPKEIAFSLGQVYMLFDDGIYVLMDHTPKLLLSGSFDDMLVLNNSILLARDNEILSLNTTGYAVHTSNHNHAISCEADGSYWVGQNQQLVRISEGEVRQAVEIPASSDKLYVSAVAHSPDYVFAGTLGEGLFVFNKSGKLVKHFLVNEHNNQNNIIQLRLDGNVLWIAYLNGVTTVDVSTLEITNRFDNLLQNNYLYCIEPISSDHFFVGTSHNGLLEYNKGQLKKMLGKQTIYSLASNNGRLYAGNKDGEIYSIQNGRSSRIFQGNSVSSILALDDEVLLLADENRAFVFNIRANRVFPLENFELNNCQLNGISECLDRAVVTYENGLLVLNKTGLSALSKMDLHLNQPRLFNTTIPDDVKQLKHNQNTISFNYHLNTYYLNKNIYFKYRLLGLDSTWKTTEQNSIEYFKLPPGAYRFEVSFGHVPGFEVESPAGYGFIIQKPFWQRLWFQVSMLLLIVLCLVFLLRLREKRFAKKQERLRQDLMFELYQLRSQINPHFLFNSFNSLIGLIEVNPEQAAIAAEKLSNLYRSILEYQSRDFVSLKEELDLARNYFELHKLRFEDLIDLQIDVNNTAGMVLPLSTQFLIENAIKHNVVNRLNKLFVRITEVDGYLVVSNNLNPRKNGGNTSGYGLKNLKERYQLLTDKPLIVKKEQNSFSVKLPIVYDPVRNY